MALSVEAQQMRQTMLDNYFRAPFDDPDAFKEAIERSRRFQNTPHEMPAKYYELANIEAFKTPGGAPFYVFTPLDGVTNDMNVIYYHGGGFVMEIEADFWGGYIDIANRLGCAVTVPLYRQYPTWRWQETYADAFDVYKHVLESTPAEKITFIGESAGGHLVLSTAILAKQEGLPQPGFLVPMSPWLDFTNEIGPKRELAKKDLLLGWLAMTELPKLWAPDMYDKKEFPVGLPYADYEGLAPCFITAGGDEMFLPDAEFLDAKLTEAGVEHELYVVDGMWHAFVGMPGIPECQDTLTLILEKIAKLA